MVDTEEIFRYKVPNNGKLLACGFKPEGENFVSDIPVMDNQFILKAHVSASEFIGFKVFETDTDEEYALVHVESATGAFVSSVRDACEAVLRDVADKCFDTVTLKAEQTRRVISFIENEFDVKPEYPWDDTPDAAVFRSSKNDKWFGLIMNIGMKKLGINSEGKVDVMNLKGVPEDIEKMVDGISVFKAYHMNKKHWFTIPLNGTLTDEYVFELIGKSKELIEKRH